MSTTVKVTITRNTRTSKEREYWNFVDKTAKEVASWPSWMKGDLASQTADKAATASTNASKTTSSRNGDSR